MNGNSFRAGVLTSIQNYIRKACYINIFVSKLVMSKSVNIIILYCTGFFPNYIKLGFFLNTSI